MKRLLTLLVIPLLLAGAFVVLQPAPASAAQTQAQANACYKRYNGKVLLKRATNPSLPESSPAEKFNASNCAAANQGNCTSVSQGNSVKVGCTTQPGARPDADAVDKATSDKGFENLADPAYGAAASCAKKGCNIVANYINPIIIVLSALVGMAVVIGIIIGGIQVSTSAGDPQKSANGKRHIQSALIALVAYILLYAFLQFLIPGVDL